jgi:LEA14-like dessication related protein
LVSTYILLIIFLTSCKYEDIEFKKLDDFKLDKLNFNEVSATVYAEVSNPNTYKIKITEYDIDVSLNGITFKASNPEAGIVIPAKSDSRIEIPLDLTLESNLLSGKTIKLIAETFTKKSAMITLVGNVKVKVALLTKNISLDEKTVVHFD